MSNKHTKHIKKLIKKEKEALNKAIATYGVNSSMAGYHRQRLSEHERLL